MRIGFMGLVAALLVGAGAVGYWQLNREPSLATAEASTDPEGGLPLVEVEAAAVDRIEISIPAVGSLRSDESITMSPEIDGRLSEIRVKEGEKVKAGTVVAVLDQSVYLAEIAQIEASLALSRANFQRATELLQRNAGTVRARDEAQAALRQDEASLALAKAQLEKTRIVAPFDGVLGLRRVSLGQYLQAGTEVINLEAIDPLKVDFRVPELYFPVVRVGQEISISVDALPGESFAGTVYAIDPQVDVGGRSIVIRARVPNPDERLRPGLFVRVSLVYDAREAAVLVPEQAIVPIGGKKFVYRLIDGRVVQTEVVLGERVGTRVEIRSGVAAGELVVTAGQLRIDDGDAVRVRPAKGDG